MVPCLEGEAAAGRGGGKGRGRLWGPSPSRERRAEAAGISSPSGLYPRGREPPGRKCLPGDRAGQLHEGEAVIQISPLLIWLALPLQGEDTGPIGLIRKRAVGSWQARGSSSPRPPRSGYCRAELLALLPVLLLSGAACCSTSKHFHIRQPQGSPPLAVTLGDFLSRAHSQAPSPQVHLLFSGSPL